MKAKAFNALTELECHCVDGEFELMAETDRLMKWMDDFQNDSKSLSSREAEIDPPAPRHIFHDIPSLQTSQGADSPSGTHRKAQPPINPFLAAHSDGVTFFHECARQKNLIEIPEEFWTSDIYQAVDLYGETWVHWAARHGSIFQIPGKFLDPTLLMSVDSLGESPLHKAAFAGYLIQFPHTFLTERFLTQQNYLGQNVLHRSAYGGHIRQIPPNFLIPEFLNSQDHRGYSVYALASQSGCASDLPNPTS